MVNSRGISTRSLLKSVALYALFLSTSIQAITPSSPTNRSTTLTEIPATEQSDDGNLASISTDAVDDIATSEESSCHLVAEDAGLEVGLSFTTDHTCSSGGVGCVGSNCRICKTTAINYSEMYPDCPEAADDEVQVTVSEGESDGKTTGRSIQSAPELVLFGFVGVVAAVALTVVAMRRKLLEPIQSTPESLNIDLDEVVNEKITSGKPSTPVAQDKTSKTVEAKI